MGLDMYFSRREYIGKDWDNTRAVETFTIDTMYGKKAFTTKDLKELIYDAGYWRKANAIHNWFVRNVQEGEDDCKEYYVSTDQMTELLGLVNLVLKSSKLVKVKGQEAKVMQHTAIAEELLPTESGFFFGDTEYNEWYYRDLEETKKILEAALKYEGSDFYYSSSW